MSQKDKLRDYRAAMDALEGHPYGREADELINLVFDSGPSSPRRKLAVANWLREYVAARAFGCTGLTADPEGPALHGPESDATASDLADEIYEDQEAVLKLRDEAERPEPSKPPRPRGFRYYTGRPGVPDWDME